MAQNRPSVKADVYVRRYTLLVVHVRKEEEEEVHKQTNKRRSKHYPAIM